jgi:hypothetical protein
MADNNNTPLENEITPYSQKDKNHAKRFNSYSPNMVNFFQTNTTNACYMTGLSTFVHKWNKH